MHTIEKNARQTKSRKSELTNLKHEDQYLHFFKSPYGVKAQWSSTKIYINASLLVYIDV